jgi:hypothetical protein
MVLLSFFFFFFSISMFSPHVQINQIAFLPARSQDPSLFKPCTKKAVGEMFRTCDQIKINFSAEPTLQLHSTNTKNKWKHLAKAVCALLRP